MKVYEEVIIWKKKVWKNTGPLVNEFHILKSILI